jgi:hypothetical protein
MILAANEAFVPALPLHALANYLHDDAKLVLSWHVGGIWLWWVTSLNGDDPVLQVVKLSLDVVKVDAGVLLQGEKLFLEGLTLGHASAAGMNCNLLVYPGEDKAGSERVWKTVVQHGDVAKAG